MKTLVLSILMAGGLSMVPPAVRLVPSQYPTIQAAIDASSDGDIVRVAPGTYTGAGNRDISFLGKSITVTSSHGAAATIIDVQGSQQQVHQGFLIPAGGPAVLNGFTIRNAWSNAMGGAIYSTGSSPTITNNVIQDCHSTSGGGAFASYAASVTLRFNTMTGNSGGLGGGIYVHSGTLLLEGNLFETNSAGFYGGAVCCYLSSPTLRDNLIRDNTAAYMGGGVSLQYTGPALLERNLLLQNVVSQKGGGLAVQGTGLSVVTIHSNTFSDNVANYTGGALYVESSKPSVTNNLFSGNTTTGHGGAVHWFGAPDSPSFANNTIVGNHADQRGGGIKVGYESHLTVVNCILWGNTAPQGAGPQIDVRPEFGESISVMWSNIQGGWEGPANLDSDPLFIDAEEANFRLAPGSPCLDSANANAAPLLDKDGLPRADDPQAGNTGYGYVPYADRGAYERQQLSVTGISPRRGKRSGGTIVTITGEGFTPAEDMSVQFGGVEAAQLTVIGPTQLMVVTPAHAAGRVDVTVTNSYGTVTLPGAFRYVR